jgi:hypothetical protein
VDDGQHPIVLTREPDTFQARSPGHEGAFNLRGENLQEARFCEPTELGHPAFPGCYDTGGDVREDAVLRFWRPQINPQGTHMRQAWEVANPPLVPGPPVKFELYSRCNPKGSGRTWTLEVEPVAK